MTYNLEGEKYFKIWELFGFVFERQLLLTH